MPITITTTRFPFISLAKALERAEQLYNADGKGRPLAVPTAFAAWGYSDKSSGGHQTVAALKMYGLLTDSGANEDRRVSLTQDALHYFADERDEERLKAIQRFALKPKLISALWEEWGAAPPSDNVARSHLKIDRKLNDQSARSLLSIYKDNLAFANLSGSASVEERDADRPGTAKAEALADREPVVVGDYVQWSPGGVDHFRDPPRVRAVTPDGKWVFVEGSETGIPMAQVEVRSAGRSGLPPLPVGGEQPPTLPLSPAPQQAQTDTVELARKSANTVSPALNVPHLDIRGDTVRIEALLDFDGLSDLEGKIQALKMLMKPSGKSSRAAPTAESRILGSEDFED